jgi:hypothetical protein
MVNLKQKIEKFNRQGYIHLKNVIPPLLLAHTRYRAIELKNKYKKFEGQPRENGSGMFWKGLEMASTLDKELFDSYTAPFMYDIAKSFLQTEPYLFNDQVVVKLPKEPFKFGIHYDNQYGPDSIGASEGKFKTINCSWILTNMPKETGPLYCQNQQLAEWELLPAKAGDIVIIDGQTPHSSKENTTDKIRALYACVYSSHPIGNFQKGFYNEKFSKREH